MAARHKSRKIKTRKGSLVSQVQRGAIQPGLRIARELTGLGTSITSLGALKNRRRPGPGESGYVDSQAGARKRGRSSLTYSQAMKLAKSSGHHSGDTGSFDAWLKRHKLEGRSDLTKNKLRQAYEEGVFSGDPFGKNPTKSAAQYRLAQAVLSGTARSEMPKSVAQEIVDRTPAKLRSQYMKMKSNPEAEAAAMHEAFTGYPSEYVEEVITERHVHDWLAGIGDMVLLVVTTPDGKQMEIDFNGFDPRTEELTTPDGDRVRFAVNEAGTQIYFEGGDQSLDLEALGIDEVAANRDKVEIGQADRIVYFTRKRFDDGEPINYEHDFNEEERGRLRDAKPVVIYDTLNQTIELAGGRYHVELDEQVDGMSPGLVN